MSVRYLKVPGIDEERLDDELILLHPETLQVKVLNATAAVLWDALGMLPTTTGLCGLLAEARPEISATEVEASIGRFLDDLVAAGLVVREESTTR